MSEITLTTGKVPSAIEYAWKSGLVPFLHGGPGISKSAQVFQAAAALGLPCFDVRAAQLDPVDIRGLPLVENGRTKWATPTFIPDKPAVLFFDEVNRAPVLVQNACFQIFQDKKVGEAEIPDFVKLVAAGNRENDGGGVMRMSSALCNRFLHINVEPNIDDWSKWAYSTKIDEMIIGLLRWRPALLYAFDRSANAWPSPRTWEFASNIIKSEPPFDIELALIEGSVGHAATVEYEAYAKTYRSLPNLDNVIKNPTKAVVPKDICSLYATTHALAMRSTPNNFSNILTYFNRMPIEYSVFGLKNATFRDESLCELDSFINWAQEHSDSL